MIIPIGVDCEVAEFCKRYNLRNMSLPFDWAVTYNGISKCIEDDFKHFTDPLTNRINEYDIYFHHDFSNNATIHEEKEKYNRRCQRLMNIMETSNEELIFCRKGHARRHHSEHNGKYSTITNEIIETEHLHTVLAKKYPQLKYKIVLVLFCDLCFNANEIYKSDSDTIEIHNVAGQPENATFDRCCRTIFKL